jgi:hypothetical protein
MPDPAIETSPIFWLTFTHNPGATASHSAVKRKCPPAFTGKSVICVAALAVLQAVIVVHFIGL